MRKSFLVAAIFGGLLIAACSHSTAAAGNPVGQTGVYSFNAPEGWSSGNAASTDKTTNNPGGNVVCIGPNKNGVTPKISVGSDSVFSASAAAEVYERSLRPPGNMYDLVDKSAFSTSSGVAGTRFVVTDQEKPPKSEKITYIFPATNGWTIKVTCTCNAADDAELRPVFDAAMKTMMFGGG